MGCFQSFQTSIQGHWQGIRNLRDAALSYQAKRRQAVGICPRLNLVSLFTDTRRTGNVPALITAAFPRSRSDLRFLELYQETLGRELTRTTKADAVPTQCFPSSRSC